MLGLCRLGRSPSHIVLRGAALLPRARTATQPPSKVLGKASRSLVPPPLAPRAHGRGGADFPHLFARRPVLPRSVPCPFYYAFSFYQVYRVKYCVFITYKYMDLKISLWCFSTDVEASL